MVAAMLIIVLVLAAIALALFVAMVVGMRNEPTYNRLNTRSPSPLATLTRRMLGVSVRTPVARRADDDADTLAEPWYAGVGYTPNRRDDEGR
jgi:NADH:ubiquinone oxidoreductase subunit 6 (subunit J)